MGLYDGEYKREDSDRDLTQLKHREYLLPLFLRGLWHAMGQAEYREVIKNIDVPTKSLGEL